MALFDHKEYERRVKQYRDWSKEETEKLKALAKSELSLHEVAKQLNKSKFAVLMRIRDISGLEVRDSKPISDNSVIIANESYEKLYKERMQRWSDDDNKRLKSKYANGENIYQLSRFFNRSPLGVLMHLQDIITNQELNEMFEFTRKLVGRTRIQHEVEPETPLSTFERNHKAVCKLSKTEKRTLELLDEGYSVEETAEKRNLVQSTIYNHVMELVRLGIVNVDDYIDIDTYNSIVEAGNEFEWDCTMKQIIESCEMEVSYDEIKLVLADLERIEEKETVKSKDKDIAIPASWIKEWARNKNNKEFAKLINMMLSEYLKHN